MKTLLVVGQTPPPYGGQAIMIQSMLEGSYDGIRLVHERMTFSLDMGEVGTFRLRKLLKLVGLIARLYYRRLKDKPDALYYPPAGPDAVPVARDVVILLTTRWLFGKTVFHFHAGGVGLFCQGLPRPVRWLCQKAYGKADLGIRLSPFTPNDPLLLGARQEKVIPYGIQDHYPQYREVVRATRSGVPTILFVGVLRESKGVSVLLEACASLTPRGFQFKLALMGDWESPEFRRSVEQLIVQAELANIVRFLGVLAGAAKYRAFAEASVFCLPTFFESEAFPVSIVEAMQFGLPVVATTWRGIPSLVEDGRTGRLVPPRDSEALARALASMLSDPDGAAAMGAAGRARYVEEFTVDVFRKRLERAFAEVMGVHDA